jgi:biotin carboxyl carrier protein
MDYRMTVGEHEERVRIDERDGRYVVTIGDRVYDVDAVRLRASSTLNLLINGRSYDAEMVPREGGYLVHLLTRSIEVEVQNEVLASAGTRRRKTPAAGVLQVASPMPGLVIEIKAVPGQRVAAGEPLVIVEAMKMRNEFAAPAAAVVKDVKIKAGQTVTGGQVLITLEAVPEG